MNTARKAFQQYLVFALLAVSLGLMLFVFALRSPGAQRAAQTFDGTKMKTSLPPYPWDTSYVSTSFAAPVVAPVAEHTVRLKWFQTNNANGLTCRGWVIEESTNLTTWRVVRTISNDGTTNNPIRANCWVTNDFQSSANPAFWKVGAW